MLWKYQVLATLDKSQSPSFSGRKNVPPQYITQEHGTPLASMRPIVQYHRQDQLITARLLVSMSTIVLSCWSTFLPSNLESSLQCLHLSRAQIEKWEIHEILPSWYKAHNWRFGRRCCYGLCLNITLILSEEDNFIVVITSRTDPYKVNEIEALLA